MRNLSAESNGRVRQGVGARRQSYPRYHKLPNKKASARYGIPSLKVVEQKNRSVPQTPPIMTPQAIATSFVCSLELDGKTVLLRISCTMTTWHGEIKLVLMTKCHLFFKAFILSSAAISVAF